MLPLADPWTNSTDTRRSRTVPWSRWVAALVVGVAAPVLQVWPMGPSGPRAGLRLLAGGLVMVVLAAVLRRPWGRVVAVVAGALVMASAVPLEGRAPACVAIGLCTLAVVSVGRATASFEGSDGSAFLLVLGLVGLVWLRTGSVRLVGAGLVLAIALLLVVVLRPSASSSADRLVDRCARGIGRFVELLVLFVVVVPFVVVPVRTAAAVTALWQRRRPPTTSWAERRVAPADDRRDAGGMWLPVPTGRRRGRNLAGAGLVLALVGGILVATHDEPSSPHGPTRAFGAPTTTAGPPTTTFVLSSTAAFRGVPWADKIQAEHESFGTDHMPKDAELGYLPGEYSGAYTHSANGSRRTWSSACAGCRQVRVWWFGGSAAWGWLERDGHTIPSELARLAAADGIDLEIRNLAAPGWTIWQEVGLFRRELARTDHPPDVAVFYDGFNDAAAGVVEASRNGRLPSGGPQLLDGDHFAEYGQNPRSLAGAGGPAAVGEAAATAYLASVAEAERLGAASKVRVVVVEQADALVSDSQLEAVRWVTGAAPSAVRGSDFALAFDSFEQTVRDAVVPARRSVAGEQRPLFADPAHMNETGAALVAADVYPRLRPSLQGRK